MMSLEASSQFTDQIELVNGSFEGIPGAQRTPPNWYDCGKINFPDETPPDTQPLEGQPWSLVSKATHGMTYIAMVARDNETWESVSQRLEKSLKGGTCYSFSVDVMRSENYKSRRRGSLSPNDLINLNQPIKLRIWGGNGFCQKKELLAETPLIEHTNWETYEYKLEPKSVLSSVTLEVFYKTPSLFPYNGNLLLDNASHLVVVPCEEEVIAAVEPPRPQPVVEPEELPSPPIYIERTRAEPEPIPRKKIITGLTKNNLRVGQTILVEQLHFKADSAQIGRDSYDALEEVYEFLVDNPNVDIEIGGHTNGIPDHDWCDNMSEARAKSVADFLTQKGIPTERVQFKGYGKRHPIASNRTDYGRALNQRVEIKILSTAG